MARSQAKLLKVRDLPTVITTSLMLYVVRLFSRPPQNKKKVIAVALKQTTEA